MEYNGEMLTKEVYSFRPWWTCSEWLLAAAMLVTTVGIILSEFFKNVG